MQSLSYTTCTCVIELNEYACIWIASTDRRSDLLTIAQQTKTSFDDHFCCCLNFQDMRRKKRWTFTDDVLVFTRRWQRQESIREAVDCSFARSKFSLISRNFFLLSWPTRSTCISAYILHRVDLTMITSDIKRELYGGMRDLFRLWVVCFHNKNKLEIHFYFLISFIVSDFERIRERWSGGWARPSMSNRLNCDVISLMLPTCFLTPSTTSLIDFHFKRPRN